MVMSGSVWGHVGDRFGVVLGSFWRRSGHVLASIWNHSGVVLGTFLYDFEVFFENRPRNAFPSSFCMKKCARVDCRRRFGPETILLQHV